ncbi:hypothetical protein [Streptomyces sp. HPF1205]|uniref:hypothetical protein n=1 Tax=Streptomyces sp. HPF1205 TaxID=2873262 RepID=UPI001CEDF276|nr:hypothetical protein [Streptomyces sp. HPF1205]
MKDVTPACEPRLARLFEMHHERLVRALRARLGRYDWYLADVIADRTWRLAADRLDRLAAADADAFPWLAELARAAQVAHFRAARASKTDGGHARAYVLPSLSPARAAVPFAVKASVRVPDGEPAATGVAA